MRQSGVHLLYSELKNNQISVIFINNSKQKWLPTISFLILDVLRQSLLPASLGGLAAASVLDGANFLLYGLVYA